ncbi:RHS repeat domain-containing protein [Streptomyces yaizuensis]|uniref:RHS repeat protein n=1 Tax=Streptomyces yaizuensis TaxID=2989713 RepID=A0ABQ5NTV5_9ACTN|nr:RHS repeat-associated core domain-containing protein [Streptomyces sp. YSPA8]GLF93441.1 RHS repeat protein [Streptomyces sp. YSPA8]
MPSIHPPRRRRLRVLTGSVLSTALFVSLLPSAAQALPPDPARDETPRQNQLDLEKLQQEKPVEGETRNARLLQIQAPEPEVHTTPPDGTATAPAGGTGSVFFESLDWPTGAFTDQPATTPPAAPPPPPKPVGTLPVKLGKARSSLLPPSGTWNVALAPRTAPESDGVDGALVTVTGPPTGAVPVSVELDYRKFENLNGADWASRLTFVQFPECYLDTPDVEECREYEELETEHDPIAKTITADVDPEADTVTVPGAPAAARAAAAGGSRAVVGAVDSGSGEGGSFKATPLASNGTWSAGSSAGAFAWSYPLQVPPAPAGPAPNLTLAYNSQAVDGKTATSSPQSSWLGEGWEYDPGHIERRYRTCKDDRKKTAAGEANNTAKKQRTSDLCWVSHNAVMSLNGKTVELVREGATNIYRPQTDDGTRVELLTGGDNGDNNGEYWLVTTPDGVKYYYGLNKIGGGHADTDSVMTVPVFGNHPGEPCHASTFAASRCNDDVNKQQAWKWGLDKVVDAHDNVMIVNWHRSANYYAVNKKTKKPEKYYRGGLPDSIEYGLREGHLGAVPTAKIDFLLQQRCVQSTTACESAKFDNTKDPASYRYWWDSPGNLNCKADSKLCPPFPSFWNRLRLGGVTTYAHRPGTTGLQKVDTFTFHHTFPRDWYQTAPGMWLNKITRVGYLPGATTGDAMGSVGTSFEPYVVGADSAHPLSPYLKDKQLPNLVLKGKKDARPPFTRPRIGAVTTEHGGEIEVTYKGGCRTEPTIDQAKNTGTCFPVRWSPGGDEDKPKIAWFNKYVVHTVTETDRITGVSDRITTRYDYKNAAWAKNDDEFTQPGLRTYSLWQGYGEVTTVKGKKITSKPGTPQTQSKSTVRYFQGTGGPVKDSTGTIELVADDARQYTGMPAETLSYKSSEGGLVSRSLTFPRSQQTAAQKREGAGDLLAHRTNTERTEERNTVGNGWRGTRSDAKFDADTGLPTEEENSVIESSSGGTIKSSDFSCSRTEYVHNTDKNVHLIGLPKSIRKTATSCADFATANPKTELLESKRLSYDGRAYGEVPLKGLVTNAAEINGDGSAHDATTVTTYDPLGRPRTVTEPLKGTTETVYTPGDTGGPLTGVKKINAKLHSATSTLDPGRGLEIAATDTNGRAIRKEYDALGRLVQGWTPARSTGGKSADVKISYQSAQIKEKSTLPAAVTVQKIDDTGGYDKHITVYDGLMRAVQTQAEAHGPGRIVTDTTYDDTGAVKEQTSPYLAKGDPAPTQFKRRSDTLVPSITRTRYDGLGRGVRSLTYHGLAHVATATTEYGETSTLVRPAGGAAPVTQSWTDARGRVTKVQHATDAAGTQWRDTTYAFDARGNRIKATDPVGNNWTWEYDTRGRLVGATDPDTGAITHGYDAADRQILTTDAKGATHTEYDVLGRVLAVREGTKLSKSYAYDTLPGAVGMQVSSTRHDTTGDYISRVTGFDVSYLPTGSETVIPAHEATKGVAGTYAYAFSYTPTGKPHSVTLPATGGLAQEKVITRYNEDGLAETTSGIDWYTSGVSYSPFGEVLRATTGPQPYRVWTTNFFDEHTGRLQRTVTDRETHFPRITDSYYAYDAAGNITANARKMPEGNGTTSVWDNQCFTYDVLGQLNHAWTSNIQPGLAATGCKADNGATWGPRTDGKNSSGPVARAADSAADTLTPDTELRNSLAAAAPAAGTVSNGATAYRQSYEFDVIGNRSRMVEHNTADATKNVTLTYGHGVTVPGNGTTPSRLDQPHTLTSVTSSQTGGNSTFRYDAQGNTTAREIPGRKQDLTWTEENRLDTITESGKKTTYVYDAGGNRILEHSPTGAKLYLGGTELTTAAGKITRAERSYSQAGAPTVVRTTVNGATTGHKLAVLLTDHLGTATTAVEQSPGQPITRRAFKPYGELRGPKPVQWPNNRTYLGVGIDDPSGLTHIGAREYDQTTGRFISADPVVDLSDPLQMNGYTYSNGSPITRSDPTGLWSTPGWMKTGARWVADGGKATWHATVDFSNKTAESWHRFTGDHAMANRYKAEREGTANGPFNATNFLKGVAGKPSSSQVYKAVYALVDFLMPILPGAGMALSAMAKGAAKAPAATTKAAKVTTSLASEGVEKAAKPAAKPSVKQSRAGMAPVKPSDRGVGATKRQPKVEINQPAAGWSVESRVAEMDGLVQDFALRTSNSSKPNRTYVGALNIDTGQIALAGSGSPAGAKMSWCAEGNACNAVGGDASRLIFSHAYQVATKANPPHTTPRAVCEKCQADYLIEFFVDGIDWDEGPWDAITGRRR